MFERKYKIYPSKGKKMLFSLTFSQNYDRLKSKYTSIAVYFESQKLLLRSIAPSNNFSGLLKQKVKLSDVPSAFPNQEARGHLPDSAAEVRRFGDNKFCLTAIASRWAVVSELVTFCFLLKRFLVLILTPNGEALTKKIKKYDRRSLPSARYLAENRPQQNDRDSLGRARAHSASPARQPRLALLHARPGRRNCAVGQSHKLFSRHKLSASLIALSFLYYPTPTPKQI